VEKAIIHPGKGLERVKKKYSRHSSVRDVNKRYGRIIRPSSRRKKTKAMRGVITVRKKRIVLGSVIVALAFGLGVCLLLFIFGRSGQ
jgi:hypothetical protein